MTANDTDGELSDYLKFRGKCQELCNEAIKVDSSLTLVRGHYYCPIWNSFEAHWWTVRPDGSIHDPTARQFPSKGHGEYVPFDGMVECSECGKRILEEEALIKGNGHYAFCSMGCYARFVGIES